MIRSHMSSDEDYLAGAMSDVQELEEEDEIEKDV
jgi:hypothetical protein